MKPVIETHLLGKKYSLAKVARYQVLRDVVANSFKAFFSGDHKIQHDFWALQDINLKIERGERVGIIGNNGAGKSTLLKILSSIIPPTTGSAIIRGRLVSLLEVGTGFHPELTGRENIYFNGSILGLKKAEIRRQFDAIVEFSSMSAFLDVPLKNYSTGMELRLAFAVAAHLEPEILLIDEVLAVGDMEFQKKCLEKMDEISQSNGKTILFVSHNLAAVKQLCNTAILIDNGKIINSGAANDIVNKYVANSFATTPSAYYYVSNEKTIPKAIFFKTAFFADAAGINKTIFQLEDEIFTHIEIENKARERFFSVGFAINDLTGRRVITDSCQINCTPGETIVHLQLLLPRSILTPGMFTVDLAIEGKGSELIDFVKDAIRFELVKSGTKYELLNYDYGVINTTFSWSVKKNTGPN